VKRVWQAKEAAIQVMTQFVEEGAEKCPKRHHPVLAGGPHPDRHLRWNSSTGGGVEAVKLSPVSVGAGGQHLHPERRDSEPLCERGHKPLSGRLADEAVFAGQGVSQLIDQRAEGPRSLKGDRSDPVASLVDRLLGSGQPRVVRERHRSAELLLEDL
jgi:hypothetical protein